MENNKKILNVPNLRFPEFKNEWISSELNSEALFLKGAVLSKNELSESGRPCILYGQLYTTYKNETIDEVISKTNCKDKNLFIGKSNDVIIPASGETPEDISTACCVLPDGVLFGGDLNVIRANHNGSFLSYQLNGKRKYDIAKLAVGKSIVHLHNEQLKKLVCTFPPSIQEENKIVSLLNNIDNRIKAQNKIIEHYESLIKGIKEKEFTNTKNKAKYLLKDIIYERKEYSQKDDGFEHVTLSKDGILPKSERYNRDFLVKDEEKEYKITKLNDICYNPANLKFGVICRNNYGESIFSPIYVTYEVKKDYDSLYISYYLCRNNFIKMIRKYEQGTVYERMSVSSEDFLKGVVFLPSLNEQILISKKIKTIENKIQLEKKYLDMLLAQKKYFLENLFI